MEDTPQDPYGEPAQPADAGAYDPRSHAQWSVQQPIAPQQPSTPIAPAPQWHQGDQGYPQPYAEHAYAEHGYGTSAPATDPSSYDTGRPYDPAQDPAQGTSTAWAPEPVATYAAPQPQEATGHAAPSKDNRPLVIAVAAVAAVVVLAGAFFLLRGGSAYSDDPAAYIPKEVDGKDVTTDNSMLDAIPNAMLGVQGGSKDFETEVASTQGETEVPGIVMMAAKANGGDNVLSTIVHNAEAIQRGGADTQRSEINGVEAVFIKQDSQGAAFEVGIAAPRDDVALVCIAFGGDRASVTKCLDAMLDSGG